KQQKFR
ncbi:hypothetical protein ABKN59_006864, partial [Abortiporus biennis]